MTKRRHLRLGDDLYIRSVNGRTAAWFRGVQVRHQGHIRAGGVDNDVTLGGLLLLGARAGDILGRRRMFVAGLALFTAGSLAVCLAQSALWLVAARGVQGVGAAILAPSTLALLSTSFPEGSERTRAVAYYGAVAGVGASDSRWAACSPDGSPGAPGSSSTCQSGSP